MTLDCKRWQRYEENGRHDMKTLLLLLALAIPCRAQDVELIPLPLDGSTVHGGNTGLAQPWALNDSQANYIQTDNGWTGDAYDSVPIGEGESDTLCITIKAENVRFQILAMDASMYEGKMIADTFGPMDWGVRKFPLTGIERAARYIMLWVPVEDWATNPPTVNKEDQRLFYGRAWVTKASADKVNYGNPYFTLRPQSKIRFYDELGREVDSTSRMARFRRETR